MAGSEILSGKRAACLLRCVPPSRTLKSYFLVGAAGLGAVRVAAGAGGFLLAGCAGLGGALEGFAAEPPGFVIAALAGFF